MANRMIITHCVDCDCTFNFERAQEHYESTPHINACWNNLPDDIRRRLQEENKDNRRGKSKPSRLRG